MYHLCWEKTTVIQWYHDCCGTSVVEQAPPTSNYKCTYLSCFGKQCLFLKINHKNLKEGSMEIHFSFCLHVLQAHGTTLALWFVSWSLVKIIQKMATTDGLSYPWATMDHFPHFLFTLYLSVLLLLTVFVYSEYSEIVIILCCQWASCWSYFGVSGGCFKLNYFQIASRICDNRVSFKWTAFKLLICVMNSVASYLEKVIWLLINLATLLITCF